MNAQLLLLLALVGPFCAFTHASPTVLPTPDVYASVTEKGTEDTTDATAPGAPEADPTQNTPEVDISVVTGAPVTAVAVPHEDVTTEVASMEVVTEAMPPASTVHTKEEITETAAATPAAATTAAPEAQTLPVTDHPAVETAAPTMAKEAGVDVEVTERPENVLIDDYPSSGQVVGIVIGALVAVVIVIAVVIAVMRRMGKYSSAKSKKPAKKDSVMVSPLRKKSAKQQERPKFWKF